MEYAAYNFKLDGDIKSYDAPTEICVKASNYPEAEKLAKELLKGSKTKLGELRRVVDCRLQVQESNVTSNITEHKLSVEERQLNVNHSGEITEVRVDGGKK